MKRTILFVLAALLLVALVVDQSDAQAIRRVVDLKNYTRVQNSAGDSLSLVGLEWNGMWPDSVRAEWYTSGAANDSIKCFISSKARKGNGSYTYTAQDSCKARESDYKTLAGSVWTSADEVTLSVVGQAAGNYAVAANAVKLSIRLTLFYHK